MPQHEQDWQTPYRNPRLACRGMAIHAAACHGGAKTEFLGHAAACPIHAAACRQESAGLILASKVKDSYVIVLSLHI